MPKKILIIKLGARGDVLRTTSILYGLKRKYPRCHVTWFTKIESLPLILNHHYIDKALNYNNKNLLKLKNSRFDLVINLDEDLEACSIATKIKGKKIGFYLDQGKVVPTPSAKKVFDMSSLGKSPLNDKLKKENKKTYQELIAEIVGIPSKNNDLILRLDDKQKKYFRHFLRQFNLDLKKDLIIGLNTGTGTKWPSKNWSIENTAKLAEKFHKELNAKVILFGGSNEIERNNQIISLSKVPIINSGCGNNLFEFPALISLCNLMITSDTMGLHLSVALKRKIIVLIGPTSSSEIELYNLGEKIIAKKCACCYSPTCKSMDTITVNDVFKKAKKVLSKPKISFVITAYKELGISKAIESLLNQEINYDHEITVACPDEETKKIVKKYPSVKHFQDSGKGKSYALNEIFKIIKSDILVLTDGDVCLGEDINSLLDKFKDPLIGCVGGRPVSSNSKNNMIGFWSHLLLDAGAHNIRKENAKTGFLECSGYLFAFRNLIKKIPLDVAEDTVIPYMFWEKGYKIDYADKALVFVKNPESINDWINQKKRTSKAHETLDKYVDVNITPRVKTLINEIRRGSLWALAYPKNLKELYWTSILFLFRLYMWISVHTEVRIEKKHYSDAWERIESAR